MSKQTVTGVAEGHLLHKDFLVEYDPDERTWTVEREVPVEPTPEPGTAGMATVRGVENVRVMRTDGTDGADEMWLSAVFILGYRGHQAEHVTGFVPDPKPGVIPDDVANAIAANWQARLDKATREATRMKALADSQTDIATKALDDRDAAEERARLAERDARAEHAEVERLRGRLSTIGEDRNALALRLDRLSVESVREALRTAQRDAQTGEPWFDEAVQRVLRIVTDDEPRVSTPAVTTPGTETPAETPAPAAFVLPEQEAVEALLRNYSTTVTRNRAPGDFGAVAHYADQILALLAEHAVTEVGLTAALKATWTLGGMDAVRATRILAHLTGKAS